MPKWIVVREKKITQKEQRFYKFEKEDKHYVQEIINEKISFHRISQSEKQKKEVR